MFLSTGTSEENTSSPSSRETTPSSTTTSIPPASGYSTGQRLGPGGWEKVGGKSRSGGGKGGSPRIRPNRMKLAEDVPSDDELAAIKNKKKVNKT